MDDLDDCATCGGTALEEFDVTEGDYQALQEQVDHDRRLLEAAYEVLRWGPREDAQAQEWKVLVLAIQERLREA